jgi:hypothetical protein
MIKQGLVAEISGAAPWRWLSSDAVRPFPRDPYFAPKAGLILGLAERIGSALPWRLARLNASKMRAF